MSIASCPDPIIQTIFSYLNPKELCIVAQVCKKTLEISSSDLLWNSVLLTRKITCKPNCSKQLALSYFKNNCKVQYLEFFNLKSSNDIYNDKLLIDERFRSELQDLVRKVAAELFNEALEPNAIKNLMQVIALLHDANISCNADIFNEAGILALLGLTRDFASLLRAILVANFSEESVLRFLLATNLQKEVSKSFKEELFKLSEQNQYSSQVFVLLEERFFVAP